MPEVKYRCRDERGRAAGREYLVERLGLERIARSSRLSRAQSMQRKRGSHANAMVEYWDLVCQIAAKFHSRSSGMSIETISGSDVRKGGKGIIEAVLAFLDKVAESNARNRNYEPFGL